MSYGLLPEIERLRPLLPELVAAAKTKASYASALVTANSGLIVTKGRSEEKVSPVPPDPGIRLTVWDGATFHSVATNRIADRDYLLRLARELGEGITIHNTSAPEPGQALDRHFRTALQTNPATVGTQARQDLCHRLYSAISTSDPRIAMTQVVCQTLHEQRIFCDGNRLLSAETIRTLIFAVAVASHANRQVQNFDYLSGSGWEVTDRATDDWATRLADETVTALAAAPLAPGEYTCILAPDVAGILAHESFGHGCELDTMMRGAARAIYYIGKRVGSELVNIVDDPTRPGTNGSIFFSDDGVLSDEPIVLVRDGILQPTLMCDRYSFLMMKDRLSGLRPAASGRLETWSHPIYARMTCTYFVPRPPEQGGLTREQMIAQTEHGILLERASSGMEDPLGWGIQLQILHGHEIRSGRLTGTRYYQIGVTGYVPDVLMSVDAVGTTLDTSSAGTCGKGHKEWVRNASGGPYLRCRLKLG